MYYIETVEEMSQFVRKNIDAISSTNVGYNVDESGKIGVPVALYENYTLISPMVRSTLDLCDKDDDIPTFQTLREETSPIGLVEYSVEEENMNEQTPLLPVPPTSPLTLVRDPTYTSLPLEVMGHYDNTVMSGFIHPSALLQRLKEWIRSHYPTQEPDLEGQPLIRPTPVERDCPPVGQQPGDPVDINPPRFQLTNTGYLILVGVSIVALLIIMVTTGDRMVLMVLLKGLVCYILGRDLSRTLFGANFCPSLETF
jgi:hypothetical protein